MPFSLSVALQGKLLKEPEKVLPIFIKEFHRGLTEAVLLVQRETVLRTPVNTGALRQSVTTEVKGTGLNMQGIIGTPEKYAVPVEEGALPHFPPIGPIELWVKRKNLDLNYTGVELTIGRVAFLVARKISDKIIGGLKAHKMFHDALSASETRVERILEKAQQRILQALK